jgi:hypothetical protein
MIEGKDHSRGPLKPLINVPLCASYLFLEGKRFERVSLSRKRLMSGSNPSVFEVFFEQLLGRT